MTGGKGDLQIEAAGQGVHVQKLAGGVQTVNFLAFHGGGVDLLHADAAPGDHGFAQRPGSVHGKGQLLAGLNQPGALLPGDLAGGRVSGNAAERGHLLRQTGGIQRGQKGVQLPLAGSVQLPQKPRVQLFGSQAGFQIQQ